MENTNISNWVKLQTLLSWGTQILRKIFKGRWLLKTGQEWVDSTESGNKFISYIGEPVYRLAGNKQKVLLKKGNSNDWDITLIASILQHSKYPTKLNDKEEKKIKEENKIVNQLRDARNIFEHLSSISITNEKFEALWKEIANILVSTGQIDVESLDKLKLSKGEAGVEFKFGVYLEHKDNIAKAMELNVQANKAYKLNKFSEALDFYSQAIALPALPRRDLAILYANRSTAYLKKSSIVAEENVYCYALNDAKKARELLPGWWKGYYKIGQVYYQMNKLHKAVTAFDTALALDPTKEDVKNVRFACLHKKGKEERYEHLNPDYMDINKFWDKYYSERGIDNYRAVYEKCKPAMELLNPTLPDVWKGHEYRDEYQNYEKAAIHYLKAADNGNAEGMYNLALFYQNGTGVEQDFKKAISLLEKAASCNPKSKKGNGYNGFTVGVAESEHSLGLLYHEGVGVEKNLEAAFAWYTRAIEHGSPYAPNNLGCMYSNGEGVEQDLKKAEQLFTLAASRRNSDAMTGLADLYLQQKYPERALEWHKRAVRADVYHEKLRQKEFENLAQAMITKFEAKGVPEWERKNRLSVDGLNQYERRDRMNTNIMSDIFEKFFESEKIQIPVSSSILEESKLISENYIRKIKLSDPRRKEIIVDLREQIRFCSEHLKDGKHVLVRMSTAPPKQQRTPASIVGLKQLYFGDLDITKDHTISDCVLYVTIIDIPSTEGVSIQLAVEDAHQDIQRMALYNFGQNEDTNIKEKFEIGTKLCILNPYVRLAKDSKILLRVDDPSSVIFQPDSTKIIDMCRCCGIGGANKLCSRCKVARYCSKDCQEHDWKCYRHKSICIRH